MPAYFSHFRYKSLSTEQFKDFLYKWFTGKHGEEMKEKLDSVDWEKWLHGRGMPPVTPKFDMTLATPAYGLAKKWSHAASTHSKPKDLDFKKSDLKGWFAGQICTSSNVTSVAHL
jgi:leukotriene-A4 hydrolase